MWLLSVVWWRIPGFIPVELPIEDPIWRGVAQVVLGVLLAPATWLALGVLSLSSIIRGISVGLGLPAHRGISHNIPIAASVIGIGWFWITAALLWTTAPPWTAVAFGLAGWAGFCAALLGDWVTERSLPHVAYPVVKRVWMPPEPLRIKVGHFGETVVYWLSAAGTVWLAVAVLGPNA